VSVRSQHSGLRSPSIKSCPHKIHKRAAVCAGSADHTRRSTEFRVQSSEFMRVYTTANRLSWPYKPCLASSDVDVPL
jgi:hypothetical protein